MKKSIKLITATATAMILAGTLAPSVASASTVSDTQETQQLNNTVPNIPVAHKTEIQGNDTIITIDDNAMYSYLATQGINVPTSNLLKKAGVTKIVWHGQARYGNVDLYLSKGWLNTISAAGVGAAAGALGALLPGAGWGAAIGAISAAISAQTFSNGKIFRIRSFGYAGMVNQ